MALFGQPLEKEALYARMAATEGLALSSSADPRHGLYIPAMGLAFAVLLLDKLSWVRIGRSRDKKNTMHTEVRCPPDF